MNKEQLAQSVKMTKVDYELIKTLNKIGFLSEGNTFKKDLLNALKRSDLGEFAILQDFGTHLINNEVEVDLEMLKDEVLAEEVARRMRGKSNE